MESWEGRHLGKKKRGKKGGLTCSDLTPSPKNGQSATGGKTENALNQEVNQPPPTLTDRAVGREWEGNGRGGKKDPRYRE